MSLSTMVGQLGGLTAAADLSAKQYFLVKLASATTVNVCGAGEVALGVLINKPVSGAAADVFILGLGEVKMGGTTAIGDPLKSDANGKAVKADTLNDHIVGWANVVGAANDVSSTLVVPGSLAI